MDEGPLCLSETLVGVVDSHWPSANPRRLLPGDILLRVGHRGQPGTIRAPFPDGLQTVTNCLAARAATDDVVLLQVLRGSSKLELLVSLAKPGPKCDSEGGTGEVLEGVVLGEGQHSVFAPLAARTEQSILRFDWMKACGLAMRDIPLGPPKENSSKEEGAGVSDGDNGGGKDEEEEEEDEGEESEEGEEAEETESVRRGMHGGGLLVGVAASVLPSDPLLEADMELCRQLDGCRLGVGNVSFSLASEQADQADRADDSLCSYGSGEMPPSGGCASGMLLQEALRAGTSLAATAVAAEEDESCTYRLYTRPCSPRQLATPLSGQQQGPGPAAAIPKAVPVGSGLPKSSRGFQVRRHTIPENASPPPPQRAGGKGTEAGPPASLFTILVIPSESSSGAGKERGGGGGQQDASHRRFSDVNTTVERAMRWYAGVRGSGVALELMGAQTEVLPLRLGGMDSEKLAKMAQYGKWMVKTGDNARGDHVSVLRAVRLWLVPASEVELTLLMSASEDDSCSDWGLRLAQTAQGIVHISAVAPGSVADKAGVRMLLRMAGAKQRLLALTKVQTHVLVPAMLTKEGINCADVDAVHEQLGLHAHIRSPLHLTFAL